MGKRLAGKVAIVTGASRGIGRAISIALAQEGATIVLAARSIHKLRQTANRVRCARGKAEVVLTELTEEESIKNLVRVTREKFGRLDILVNNAGITHSAKLEQTLTEDWDRCILVNARCLFFIRHGLTWRGLKAATKIRNPNIEILNNIKLPKFECSKQERKILFEIKL